MKITNSPGTIGYQLPLSKKTIEIPKEHRNKANALACISTVEAGAGLAFMASLNPLFIGVGISILGIMAGSVAMMKGTWWDMAGKFHEKHVSKIIDSLKDKVDKNELAKIEKNLMKLR